MCDQFVETIRQSEERIRKHYESCFGPLTPAERLKSQKHMDDMEKKLRGVLANYAELVELKLAKSIAQELLKTFSEGVSKDDNPS